MTLASYASLTMVRFDSLRISGGMQSPLEKDVLFSSLGADSRAAGTLPESQQAFAFVLLGLHGTQEAAQNFVDSTKSIAPWMDEAVETWTAVLQPFRHSGDANYFDRTGGGQIFESLAEPPPATEPIVVMTSVGWQQQGLDPERVRVFSTGVQAVRISMTAVPGLHSQQSFFFPRVLEYDPITLSIWQNLDLMKSWAYQRGVHRMYMEKHRHEAMADRSSFTRFRILHRSGTWYGDALLEGRDDHSLG